jgi:hypothetical protein
MFFQISSALPPLTMLVAVIAPGLTIAFISEPLSCSTATIELKTCPVASTPCSWDRIGPCSSMTLAMVKTLEIDWIETSDLMSPAV